MKNCIIFKAWIVKNNFLLTKFYFIFKTLEIIITNHQVVPQNIWFLFMLEFLEFVCVVVKDEHFEVNISYGKLKNFSNKLLYFCHYFKLSILFTCSWCWFALLSKRIYYYKLVVCAVNVFEIESWAGMSNNRTNRPNIVIVTKHLRFWVQNLRWVCFWAKLLKPFCKQWPFKEQYVLTGLLFNVSYVELKRLVLITYSLGAEVDLILRFLFFFLLSEPFRLMTSS